MSKINLFCLPYAGGSAAIFAKWKKFLGPDIELIPVELSGHGERIGERLYIDLEDAVDDVFRIVKRRMNEGPYALFGHSLGGTIAYSLAQKIRETGSRRPVHIFFSGKSVPHVREDSRHQFHLLNNDNFKKEVIGLGGTPPELFEYPELMEIYIPMLRNDFRLADSDLREEVIRPLEENITVFLGKEDIFTMDRCDEWQQHTQQGCCIHYFDGGHFFLEEKTAQIVSLINETLLQS